MRLTLKKRPLYSRAHSPSVQIFSRSTHHGEKAVFGDVIRIAVSVVCFKIAGIKKAAQDNDEKRVGLGRSHAGVLSVFAWACACGSRPRSADLSDGRSNLFDAQDHCRRHLSRWMAVTPGDA